MEQIIEQIEQVLEGRACGGVNYDRVNKTRPEQKDMWAVWSIDFKSGFKSFFLTVDPKTKQMSIISASSLLDKLQFVADPTQPIPSQVLSLLRAVDM